MDGSATEPELARSILRLPCPAIHPPKAWTALAEAASKQGPAAFRAALSPRHYPLVEAATLADNKIARRFASRQLNAFLAQVFESIPAAVIAADLPPVHLTRWDLHHCHAFLVPAPCCGGEKDGEPRLGLLFHAK
jgi:hypothetical protein